MGKEAGGGGRHVIEDAANSKDMEQPVLRLIDGRGSDALAAVEEAADALERLALRLPDDDALRRPAVLLGRALQARLPRPSLQRVPQVLPEAG